MNPEEKRAFLNWIDNKRALFTEDILRLVKIRSVSMETENREMPFGEKCREVLSEAEKICTDKGFTFYNHENYCGSILWPGETESEIGIFNHLDIVEEGTGWSMPPFEGIVRDGCVFGRGSNDNKGPAMAVLYALWYLKESGFKPRHSIRHYYGLNEESGMKDIIYYTEHYPMPVFSFSPDSMDWPVCYGERGIVTLEAAYDIKGSVITEFCAGTAAGAVPGIAFAVLNIPSERVMEALAGRPVKVEKLKNGCRVSAEGITGAISSPEKTVNAEKILMCELRDAGILDEKSQRFAESISFVLNDSYGERIGAPISDEESGRLIHGGGKAVLDENGRVIQHIGIRYPVMANGEELHRIVENKLNKMGFDLISYTDNAPHFVDRRRPEVRVMTDICNAWLGTDLEPYVMAGGCYARKLKNAVGFGPFSGEAANRLGLSRGRGHQPDEYAAIDDLILAMGIFVDSIRELDAI